MTRLPDADTLTHDGLALDNGSGVLILACGALAREILAVIDANKMDHVTLQCLPAIFHNHPERIVPAVEEAVARARETHDRVFLAYADCGTGGQLQATAARLGVEMIEGPHCYSFFEGNDTFLARADEEFTAFYLTDFLVRQFDAFVWKPLGLDRHPELRDMYFGHYEKLVYQAQTEDPALSEKAERYAAQLGLAYERRFTGFGDLETAIAAIPR
ncbi:MAG: DUF1638 domain-containing protein [Pseudomonadota bacterium]